VQCTGFRLLGELCRPHLEGDRQVHPRRRFAYTRDERSWEGRTQVEFDLLDDNTFNGSLDWTDFNSAIQAANFKKYTGGVYVNQNTPGFDNLARTWSEDSWRLTGSYQFNDSLFSYLTMSRGYKAGGYNDQTGTSRLMVASLTRPVNPEFATNYELGFKYESPNGRFRLNPTLFMTKYDDTQRAVNIITEVSGTQFQETVFYNAAEVTSKGLEIEMQALLTDNFQLRAQASFLDAKYDTFTINQPGLTDPATGGTILPFQGDFSGLPVPRSPERSGSVQGVYTMDLAGGSLAIAGEVYFEAENLFYISAAGRDFDAYLDEKTLVNLSVTYTDAEDRYFVRAFGKNLLDERYRVASQSVATLWTHTQWGAPVNFGLEFGAKFGSSR